MSHSPIFALLTSTSLFALLLLSACGEKGPKGPEADPNSTQLMANMQMAREKMHSAQTECGMNNTSECSPSIGMLSFIQTDVPIQSGTKGIGLSMCTGFLISDRIMATNSHCIPADLKKDNSNCADRMVVHFPNVPGFPAQDIACSRILSASPIDESIEAPYDITPDYAFIELSQASARPSIAISHDGIKELEEVSVDAMDPVRDKTEGGFRGLLRHRSCKATYFSRLLPGINHYLAPILATNCKVVKGNSGSPMRDANGKAKGTFFAIKEISLPEVQNGRPVLTSFVTNFGCLRAPTDGADFIPSGDCDSKIGEALSLKNQIDLSESLQVAIYEKMTTYMKLRPFSFQSSFHWTLKKLDSEILSELLVSLSAKDALYFTVLPDCFLQPDQLAKEYRSFLFFHDDVAQEIVQLPALVVRPTMDSMLRPALDIKVAPDLAGVLAFSPSNLANLGKSRINLRAPTLSGITYFNVLDEVLAACPKPDKSATERSTSP